MKARLERLRAAGADRYDGPGFRFVEGLFRRAEALEGAAGDHLLGRAHARLTRFEEAFTGARAQAEATLAAVRAAGADPVGELAAEFDRGDYKSVIRRAKQQMLASDGGPAARRALRLARQAKARGVRLEPTLRAKAERLETHPPGPTEARQLGDALARALFREAAEHARSALVLARAQDNLPDEAGPYNPSALTTEALSLIESVSPGYLRVYLTGLEDLAALCALPEPKPTRKRRRR